MEKRNNLWYFESYQEIRDYMAQGFPSRVYLVTRRATIVKGGQVIHPKNYKRNDDNGEQVPQWQINNGYVYEPSQTEIVTVIGSLEDFPVEQYATRRNLVRHNIKAKTALEGLYKAGDLTAARLLTSSDRSTTFTAKELTQPIDKGGVVLTWPKEEQEVLYTVTTDTGRYQTTEGMVYEMIDRMEKVEGIGPAKRRRFTIKPEAVAGRKVITRMQFEADKTLPKMKKCWSTEELRTMIFYPALEMKTGVMVSCDGHILAAHKLKGYRHEVINDDLLKFDMVFIPREVTAMKGTVTIEVEVNDADDLLITATDASGRRGEVVQKERYPNWRSVIPSKVGKAIKVDAPAWEKAVKQILPQLNCASLLMYMDAEPDSKTITFSGEDYDFSKHATAQVDAKGGVNGGLWVGVKATIFLTVLSFGITDMHYTDRNRAILFHDDETVIIMMPMLIDGIDEPRGPEKIVTFSLDEWVKAEVSTAVVKSIKPVKKQTKVKAKVFTKSAPKALPRSDRQPDHGGLSDVPKGMTLEDRLRAALLKQLRMAA